MKMKLRMAAMLAAALAAPVIAWSAGLYSTFPVVGGQSFCASTVSGVVTPSSQGPFAVVPGSTQGTGQGICGQTEPAGPPSDGGTGMVPLDFYNGTQAGGPQTMGVIPQAALGAVNTKYNRLIGGDFGVNLWQRGTTPLSGASPTTYQMSADRWFAISASNVMTVSKTTPATSAADYIGNLGFYSWMRVARPSGTPTGTSCVGQILDQKASADFIGKNAVLTFEGYAPSTFSASNSAVTASIAYYTALDSATAGTNTATFALSASGQTSGITGYTAAVGGPVNGNTATVASGVATIALSTTPTLYGVYASIPQTNASGTNITGVGISICATPTLTTTVSTDYFELAAVQLQAMPSTVTTQLPAGVINYTGYERRPITLEQTMEQYYSYVLADTADTTARFGWCQAYTTGLAHCVVQFPVAMREVPSVTIGTANSFAATNATGTPQACVTLTATSGGVTVLDSDLTCNPNASNFSAAANAALFTGNNTNGTITWSSEP